MDMARQIRSISYEYFLNNSEIQYIFSDRLRVFFCRGHVLIYLAETGFNELKGSASLNK
jgi:hypothetical protein